MDGSNNAATSSLKRAVLDGCEHGDEICLPGQFQLTTSDADIHVFVQRRTKRDELKLLVVPEEPFRGLVEALCDMIQRVGRTISGIPQLLCSRYQRRSMDDKVDTLPSKNFLALRLTNTEPAKTPIGQVSTRVMTMQNDDVQSGGAISSMTRGAAARMAYELMSSVPPPASATTNP